MAATDQDRDLSTAIEPHCKCCERQTFRAYDSSEVFQNHLYSQLKQDKVIQIIPKQEFPQERLLWPLPSVKSMDSHSTIQFSLKQCIFSETVLFIKQRKLLGRASDESRRKRQREGMQKR